MNIIKKIILAGVFAIAAPIAAVAATINGTIDIVGVVSNNGMFIADGGVEFDGDGLASVSTGDFDGIMFGEAVTLTDIAFAAPGTVWSVGGFTFTATSFSDITNNSFHAVGTIIGGLFEETAGFLDFTSQGGNARASFSSTTVAAVPVPAGILLMGTALAGFGVMRRKSKKAA